MVDSDTATAAEALAYAPDDGFAALAARRLILAEMAAHRGQLDDLAILDGLHTLAVEHSIVTPYSSMIVLVNRQQEQMLERLEGQEDRFDREFEAVGETQALTVTGVPEPHEWLLLTLAAGMLGWFYWRQREEARRQVACGAQKLSHF